MEAPGGAGAAPTAAAFEQRLREARAGRACNLSYLEGLPQDFVPLLLAANPAVTELDLSSNQLTSLPNNLPALKELRVLRLKYNALQHLPPVLAELPKLSVLDVAGNQLEVIDGAALAQLTALRELDLSGNGLRAVPETISALPLLENLQLGGNAIKGLPSELGHCPSLVRLDVSGNQLLSLPPSLAQLQKIQRIDAKNNYLNRVPPCLGHLKGLREFDLRHNRLNKTYQQATEKGLARFLSFLRDDEEMERLQEIERNKPVGQQVGPCMVYKCKALTEDALASLTAAKADPEQFAWIRAGHALCMAGKIVYMFGGTVVKDGGRKNADLFWLSTDRMEWRLQPTRGDKPCPRDGHCMVYDEGRNRLVVFGGRKQNKRRLNDVHFLDLDTWMWFQPRAEGRQPSPRDHCSAGYHDGHMYIFGGRSSSTRLNELHVLDLEAWAWIVPEVSGIAPSPRQGAALTVHEEKLWVHGGRSNFVLDDCYCLDLDSGEWSRLPIEGRILPARYGHAIGHSEDSELHVFGGTDALGATVPTLYRLRKAGPAKYMWVETVLALPPNKSRSFLFSKHRLYLMQVGHSALKMPVPAADLAAGRVVWDVFQCARLKDVQEREVRPEDLVPQNAKLGRIAHCIAEVASRLPAAFTSHCTRERQALERAAQFVEGWRQRRQQHRGPQRGLLEPPLVLRNECGLNKLVCTTLRPACLPHVELHDMGGIVQFVSEYFQYEPLEVPSQPPSHLVSPWTLLDWQAGDSFDLATMLASLLIGAGYTAMVVVGFVPKHIALGDLAGTDCPHLAGLGIHQKPAPPQKLPPLPEDAPGEGRMPGGGDGVGASGAQHDSLGRISEAGEVEPGTARSELASSRGCAATAAAAAGPAAEGAGGEAASAGPSDAAAAAQGTGGSSEPGAMAKGSASGPAVDAAAAPGEAAVAATGPAGTALAPDGGAAAPAADGNVGEAAPSGAESGQQEEAAAPQAPAAPAGPPRFLHAFVLVLPGWREVAQPIFVDPGTGFSYSPAELPCEGVSYAWNQHNFWANLQQQQQHAEEGQGAPLPAPVATDWNFNNPWAWEPLMPVAVDGLDSPSMSSEFSSSPSSFVRTTQSMLLDQQPPSSFSSSRFTPRPTGQGLGAPGSGGLLRPQSHKGQGSALGQQRARTVGGTPRLGTHAASTEYDADGSLSYLAHSSLVEDPTLRAAPRTLVSEARKAGFMPGGEVPPSWVPALTLSRERLDVRCLKGSKRVQYRQCQREIFACFGECARWDGLVERYTLYEDAECTAVEAVVELFERRKDRLQRRETYPAQRLVRDSFGSGALGALRESAIVKGESRELKFYHEARADGLLGRAENIGVKMEEFFIGRPDRLLSRTVEYGPPDIALLGLVVGQRRGSLMLNNGRRDSTAGQRDSVAAQRSSVAQRGSVAQRDSVAKRESVSGAGLQRRGSVMQAPLITYPLAKVTHKFARDPTKSYDEDIAKLSFDLDEHTITVVCHRSGKEGQGAQAESSQEEEGAWSKDAGEGVEGEGVVVQEALQKRRPTCAIRVYGEGGELLKNVPGGSAPPPPAEWCAREFAWLSAARKPAELAARAGEDESQEIVMARLRQEQGVALATGHYDASRTKVEDSDDEPEGPEEEQDYLAPFLPTITGTRDMTAEEAAAVFKKCLQALKARSTERGCVLEARMEAECADIRRMEGKQTTELYSLTAAEQHRLQEQLEEARFRVRVLEQRVQNHRSVAAEKLAELEAKLQADPRLVPAIKAGLV